MWRSTVREDRRSDAVWSQAERRAEGISQTGPAACLYSLHVLHDNAQSREEHIGG